jgi:hypothetical protein
MGGPERNSSITSALVERRDMSSSGGGGGAAGASGPVKVEGVCCMWLWIHLVSTDNVRTD